MGKLHVPFEQHFSNTDRNNANRNTHPTARSSIQDRDTWINVRQNYACHLPSSILALLGFAIARVCISGFGPLISGGLYTPSCIQKPDTYPRMISVTITTNNYISTPYYYHPLHEYCKQPYFAHMLISTTVIHTRHLKHTHMFSCTTPTASTSQHVSTMNVLHLPYWHVHVIHSYICYPETSITIIVSCQVACMHWSACCRLRGCTIGSRILNIPLYISQFIQWL